MVSRSGNIFRFLSIDRTCRFWRSIYDGRCKRPRESLFVSENNFDTDIFQSLLSLPYLGFLNKTHPAYVATNKMLMSRANPYYVVGKNFSGIGYA